MANQPTEIQQPITHDAYYDAEMEGPGVLDALRYLYRKRMRFMVCFLTVFGIGILAFLYAYFTSPRMVGGIVSLNFKGIERQEYPSGKKFSVEDFRGPDLLTKAMAEAGISDKMDVRDLAAHTYITAIVPAEIQNRWRKQDKDGAMREQYSPNEFKLEIEISGFGDQQRLRLFDALIKQYQVIVKYDQESALSFVSAWDTSYEKLATRYDFWDIPTLYMDTYRLLNHRLDAVIEESLQHQDPKYQLGFRDIAKDLAAWYTTRLMALEAITYQGKLIKSKDIMTQRVQHQVEDLEIQIRKKSDEASQATHLLEIIDQPRALLAGQLSSREGVPVVDANAVDKLIKSDYVGPVVQRISKIQEEIQTMETDRSRLQKQLSWLPEATNLTLSQMPPGHRELIETLSSELKSITHNYNSLLDEYLGATSVSKVIVSQSPIVTRESYSPLTALAGIAFASALLALIYLGAEHLLKRAKETSTRKEASP